ncbi:dihydroorotate oxidase [Rhodoblastus sp.]|uniref:dihydroorotate oxidase n=1 Tax=Rhodoblastus sp. TaxID=1962975 RepID=UPI00260E31CD|nr:dihydroorotate oxidase [Rhodoblastus sp.]
MTRARDNARINAMGLTFAGPLGVAAGVDRDGSRIVSLDLAGFGHIEIGTVTPETAMAERPRGLRIGVNFGSLRPGLDDVVIADYCAALRAAHAQADYLCANLTSPRGGRDGDTPGVENLLRRLRPQRDRLAERSGRRAPLLVKVAAGNGEDAMPRAIVEARRLRFDGVVLVCADLRRIAAVKAFIGDLTLISVGGVATARDVSARMKAGASLVQTYSAFVANGAPALRGAVPATNEPTRAAV